MSNYEAVIGLEVHAQLATDSKIFAESATTAGCPPNTLTDPTTLGLPGALPVLNRRVVDFAIKLGLATHCNIARESIFARKHYHYPDLPKGYQISQYDKPICLKGFLDIPLKENKKKRIGITRIHLEEDAGKSIHLEEEAASIVDLNRAGVPLVEIVSEPDIRTPEEAGTYMRLLRQIVRYLGICDGNMEEGSLRCDANVSLRKTGSKKFGTKVEIKNLNSFRFVEKAVAYEITRQKTKLENQQSIVQETRLWDEAQGVTRTMRTKEHAEDYRYFPDPDLLPLIIEEEWIENIRETLPEMPDAVRDRFQKQMGLDAELAESLSGEKHLAQYLDRAVAAHPNAKSIANWICTELFALLKRENLKMEACPVSPENLADLLRLIDEEIISGKIAKSVFEEMFQTGSTAEAIVNAKDLKQISDKTYLENLIIEVLDANHEQIKKYHEGKKNMLGFFVGQIMKSTKGKANPRMVNEILLEQLSRRQ